MLVRRLTTILPAITLAEAIETTRIHSVAGCTSNRTALVTTRLFRAPQQTISRTLLTCSTSRADAWLGSPVSLTHQ
jgi:magnesium chelatase family protein